MIYLFKVLKTKYCISTFILSLILSYFLVPKKAFYKGYILLALLFMVLFALIVTCIVRNIKERVVLAKTYQSSVIGIIATALGIAALQVCGFGAPVCGATLGVGFFSALFPAFFSIDKYAIYLVIASILLQLLALYFMNCFKPVKKKMFLKLH